MTVTLDQAQAKVAEYLLAESEALQAHEVRLGTGGSGIDRALVNQRLSDIRLGLTHWQRVVASLQASQAGAPTVGGLSFSVADFSRN